MHYMHGNVLHLSRSVVCANYASGRLQKDDEAGPVKAASIDLSK